MQNNVLDYMNESVKRVPDKTAFADDKDAVTFRQVYDMHRSVATFLHNSGVYKEPVIVFMEKHPHTIVAFFGVIAAGDFYVPIDAEMPGARIDLILENVKPKIVICDEKTIENAKNLNTDARLVLFSDIAGTAVDDAALTEIHEKAIDTDPIYIVFTSGSTGVPKGVCACHRSVIDYIEQLSDVLKFNSETVFANQTPLYFDACLKELYPTLKFGATTYLVPKSLFMFPLKLVEFMNERKVNTVCWVVSALTMISSFKVLEKVKPEYLHTIAFGSEVFPIRQFNLWREALPNARFVNLYGPTEGTGMCCYYEVNREFSEGDAIPVGRPFKNTEILLLTEDGKRAGEGESGEMCIRGTSVTLGYYNNPEKTKESFVQNPLNTAYPEIIYRTGDIGRLNEYGELVFVSRKDYQIKHMGHRIELGEIEAGVNMVEEIKATACIYDKDSSRIVLYYVGDITEADLMNSIKKRLPRYMMPNRVYKLEKMPYTPNGKLDRKTLTEKYKSENAKG